MENYSIAEELYKTRIKVDTLITLFYEKGVFTIEEFETAREKAIEHFNKMYKIK